MTRDSGIEPFCRDSFMFGFSRDPGADRRRSWTPVVFIQPSTVSMRPLCGASGSTDTNDCDSSLRAPCCHVTTSRGEARRKETSTAADEPTAQ